MRAASSSNSPGADPAMESLVKEFSANWKLGIQQINDEVLFFFANSSSAMEILKQVTYESCYFELLLVEFLIGADTTLAVLHQVSRHHQTSFPPSSTSFRP